MDLCAPTNYGVLLFDGFQTLDAFGPIDVLNMLSRSYPVTISLVSISSDPVSAYSSSTHQSIGQKILPTHTLESPPKNLEVLLVPGGLGVRDVERTQSIVDFIERTFPKLQYLLTVCTGSVLAARAGILRGKQATSNKEAFDWVSIMTANPIS